MPSHDGSRVALDALRPELRRLRRRLNGAVWLERFLPVAIWISGVAALALLGCKLIWPMAGLWPLATLVLLIPAAAWAYLGARRVNAFFSERDLVEVADHLFRDDGALSAAYEDPRLTIDTGAAGKALAQRRPRLRWGWMLQRCAPVTAFLVIAILTPARKASALTQGDSIVNSLAQPIAEKLAMNEELITPEEQHDITQALEAIKQNDQGVSREQWEAIEELDARVAQAAERGRTNAEGMGLRAEQLAAMMNSQGNIQGEVEQQQAEALAREMEAMLKDSKRKPGAEDSKQLSGMLKQLRGGKTDADLKKRMQELAEQLKRKGECEGCKSGNCDKPGHCKANKPGRGGISRGRGDAELTFDPESKIAAKFKDQELQNQFFAPEDLADMGITPLKPDTTPGQFQMQPIRDTALGAGPDASRTRITPSQRDVLTKYFAPKP